MRVASLPLFDVNFSDLAEPAAPMVQASRTPG